MSWTETASASSQGDTSQPVSGVQGEDRGERQGKAEGDITVQRRGRRCGYSPVQVYGHRGCRRCGPRSSLCGLLRSRHDHRLGQRSEVSSTWRHGRWQMAAAATTDTSPHDATRQQRRRHYRTETTDPPPPQHSIIPSHVGSTAQHSPLIRHIYRLTSQRGPSSTPLHHLHTALTPPSHTTHLRTSSPHSAATRSQHLS